MADIRRRAPGRYDVSGSLNFTNVPDLLPAVEAAGDAREVDLAGVSRTDSAGLALLLEWARQVRSEGGALRLSGIPAQLRSLIGIAGIADLFGLEPDDETVTRPVGIAVE